MGEFVAVAMIPELAEQWDLVKNTSDITTVSAKERNQQYHWRCRKCGYSWESTPRSRLNAKGKCPCCDSGKAIQPGYNDVLTLVPALTKSYDFDFNADIDIRHQGVNSLEVVHWKCDECGRSWKSKICSRIKKENGTYSVVECPHYNTVKRKSSDVPAISEHPGLFKYWDPENTLDPNTTRSNSTARAKWICPSCHYKWETAINARETSTHQCPCCELNLVVQNGINDIFTLLPEAALTYDYEKNKDVDVSGLGVGSKTSLWWKCPDCGYEWQASVASRVRRNGGEYTFSGCQQCYFHDINRITPVASLPKLMRFWDTKKNKEIGLDANLISAHSNQNAFWRCKECGYEWSGSIKGRIGASDKCPFCEGGSTKAVKKGVNDVLTVLPELASIYDFEGNSNNGIDIYALSIRSQVEAQFVCHKCGTVWQSKIAKRVKKETDGSYRLVGCSVCDNKNRRKETYAEQYPDLAEVFDEEKNGCTLASVKSGYSNRIKYWWRCNSCNRSFPSRLQSMIVARNTSTKGCPYCSRTTLVAGESFADLYPQHMDEYSPENEVDPYKVFPHDSHSVTWICRNDSTHIWEASFSQRSSGGGKCPVCSRRIPVKGFNTFADVHSDYVSQWSPNNTRMPDETFHDASVWLNWMCPTCNNEYGAYIKDVISEEEACPYCAGRRILPGKNSFAAKHPELMEEWDYVNNYALTDPDRIGEMHREPVWWICKQNPDHTYTMSPARRLEYQERKRVACPECKGLRRKKLHYI